MDSVDSAINTFLIRFMLSNSSDISDEQIKYLFEKVMELPCQEHGSGCFSNTVFIKLDEQTRNSFKSKFKQLSEGFKIADLSSKSSMIENVSNEMKGIIGYTPESKCITHIIAEKILIRCRSMMTGQGGNPGLNLFSMFSGLPIAQGLSVEQTHSGLPIAPGLSVEQTHSVLPNSQQPLNTQNALQATSLVTKSRFKPVYNDL